MHDSVKEYDKDFEKDSKYPIYFSPEPVNPLLLNDDGTPKSFYHQTGGNFTTFDTDNPVAGKNDSETPNGIFLKSSDRDIGLQGKNQMHLYVFVKNILNFNDRKEATKWYENNIPGLK